MTAWQISTVILCFFLACCEEEPTFVTIDPAIVDRPDKVMFDLSYTNQSKYGLCLSEGNWPNSAGMLGHARGLATLIVAERRFPIGAFNTGYCPGEECTVRIEPGATITGFLLYENFSLPESLRYQPKRLEILLRAYVCERSPPPYRPKLKPDTGRSS